MEREVEIRTLDGELITLMISRDRSIRELKAILKESFLPAKNCPNFHLFFKGAKLRLDSAIESLHIDRGEFIVLIPFAKKSLQLSGEVDPADQSTASSKPCEVSAASISAWQDIMNDLSSISQTSQADTTPKDVGPSNIVNSVKEKVSMKRKRNVDNDCVIREILRSDFENVFEPHSSDRIRRVVEPVSCLCSDTGCCFLFEEFFKLSNITEQCMCPPWLKRLLKVFTFLNVFYAFFQMQCKCLTWDYLEGAMRQAHSFGLDNFSVLTGQLGVLVRKRAPISTVINSLTKRWNVFKAALWKSAKKKKLSESGKPLELSLEDLILLENYGAASVASDAKIAKMTSSASLCHNVEPMEPVAMVEHLKQGTGKREQIVHIEIIEAKEAVYVELPNDLSKTMKEALKQIGISKLYSHQAEAIQSSLSGKNVVVATSTSSGKSLCYNLPVLESLSQSSLSCALYIFPTKALAQDQLRTLLEMKKGLDIDIQISIYDGDTSKEDRIWTRNNARLLITNPDMLHVSILPYHGLFQRILSNLRYIVIDEAHAYKGAFGCHTALVLRRLCRICSNVYGCDPSFILCTATSANPRDHAMELANLPNLELIQNDGSPCGPKYFLLWNPPLYSTNPNIRGIVPLGGNGSTWTSLHCFLERLKNLDVHRREILQATAENLVDTVCVYRAGYIPQDRRRIESDLFEGRIRGVAATNALELGIDVGHIDATLHLGFPGSVASLWQQAGRSGRRAKPSLAVYVAFEGPLDQYFMKFPQKLFGRPIEHCQVDSHNQKVLEQHVACAAYEYPLCLQYDEKYFGAGLNRATMALKNKGYIRNDPTGAFSTKMWKYSGPEERPSYAVSIRAVENDRYRVINKLSNELLEEIEESRAFFQVYEGAVYMHQGSTYLVEDLDLPSRTALCRKADLKYYTKTRDYTDIHVIGSDLGYPPLHESHFEHVRTTAQANPCRVTTNWFGFYRIWKASNQIFDTVELTLPAYSYESQAAWIRIPLSVKTAVEAQNLPLRAGSHAASHALLNVVPMYMMCNASDLGTECANPHDARAIPERLLLYDRHPGGIGITLQVQILFGELLIAALELVSTCSCSSSVGCPNCIQTLSCGEYNEVLDKETAIVILKGVIESERSYFQSSEDSSER
ncbi:ATP-dependent helicase HRQ1 [Ananas comosus]|uniref:ATP-dependent helicase HRQ1 n=1 Tax=Ananas comosus TaxID=4615 RepID=A0A199VIM3_ANACO|nr:ATP-dependent helicase HRQ1 [Ananas comosus]